MTISFNNYAEKIGSREIKGSKQDWFKFRVFVEGSDDELENIEYVEYELHPSIPNPYRPVADKSSKFAVTFNSWGRFTVRMTIKFKNGTEKTDVLSLKDDNPFPGKPAPLPPELKGAFVLKTTSFFKKERQKEYLKEHPEFERMKLYNPELEDIKLYNVQAIIDSSIEGALEKVDRVEYFLAAFPERYQHPIRYDYKDKFLLKEIAFGNFTLEAKVFLKGEKEPIELQNHIELQEAGPRLDSENDKD